MTLTIKQLIAYLEIKNLRLRELRRLIVDSFGSPFQMQALLNGQYVDANETKCILCEDDGDCAILTGVMMFDLHANGVEIIPPETKPNRELAILKLELAKIRLRNKSKTWNWIVGLVILGLILETDGKKCLALREYKEACEVLSKYYLRIYRNEYLSEAQQLRSELEKKLQQLSIFRLIPLPVVPVPLDPARPAPIPPEPLAEDISPVPKESPTPTPMFTDERDYLALFSIPVYGTVQAGLDGKLHVDHFDVFTIVNQIELKKQVYDVYNIHGASDSDRQVTITTKREHGWLRVAGLSMNGWDLPLNENDYVLFYKSQVANPLDYVIASNPDQSGEMSLIVKRLNAEKNQLLSKSKDTSKKYDPIPVDAEHRIMGIVLAVAKPVK